mmetsp:Transcript_9223/g.17624  ORF Transcript_9223/g.17624 Transcript_9223/m.17624 type:complete len:189 (+) Transcript_9223:2080-2646(+)
MTMFVIVLQILSWGKAWAQTEDELVANLPMRTTGVDIAQTYVNKALSTLNGSRTPGGEETLTFAPFESWNSGFAFRSLLDETRGIAITGRPINRLDYERHNCQNEVGIGCCDGVLPGPGPEGITWGGDTLAFYVNRNHPLRKSFGNVTPRKLETIMEGYIDEATGVQMKKMTHALKKSVPNKKDFSIR